MSVPPSIGRLRGARRTQHGLRDHDNAIGLVIVPADCQAGQATLFTGRRGE